MPQFDPRLSPTRYAPAVLGCAAVLAAAGAGVGVAVAVSPATPATEQVAQAPPTPAPRLRNRTAAVSVPVRVQPGETLMAAVQRTGVAADEARQVVSLLGGALDTVHIRAGLAFQAAVMHPADRTGPPRLIGFSIRTGPASEVTLSRAPGGELQLRELEEEVRRETHVASGVMKGSLYESAIRAGASPSLVAQATKLFAKKLDFARDIHPGDAFRLAFDRTVTETGKTVETGELLYAEIGVKGRVTRFYRFEHDGETEFLDEVGQETKALLLKTPLEGAHVTSSFGLRLHPVLGFNRLHPGVDFGAASGTPVFAAGDGVVEEARWAGGYGRWLKLRHSQGFGTGYGHLSRFAAGVKSGTKVRQGQVVAYVGSTGLSTGPHLHYELMRGGRKVNPHGAKLPVQGALNAAEIAAFKAQKARINAILQRGAPAPAPAYRTAALRTTTLS